MKIGVIGLGYVGLPLAISFSRFYEVVGFDIKQQRVEELNAGIDVTLEADPEVLSASEKLVFTFDPARLSDVDVFIITVPTPVDEANNPDLTPLVSASKMVGGLLKKDSIVIYESTVYPGCTEEVCVPILEAYSNLKFNEDFYCGYSPERINPADKENTLESVVKVVSGSDEATAKKVENLYSSVITAGVYKAASIKVAEAAKVIENVQRDINIALINELSVIFRKLNIDTGDVLSAASTKWNFLKFKPGLVGGHCIGVDPYYLTYKAQSVGYIPQVILSGRRINDSMARYSARQLIKEISNSGKNVSGSKVLVAGCTFKENCPDMRNSKVFDLIDEFRSWDCEVDVFDPYVNRNDFEKMDSEAQLIEDVSSKYDTIVFAVGHDLLKENGSDLLNNNTIKGAVVGDLKGIFDLNALLNKGFRVFRL